MSKTQCISPGGRTRQTGRSARAHLGLGLERCCVAVSCRGGAARLVCAIPPRAVVHVLGRRCGWLGKQRWRLCAHLGPTDAPRQQRCDVSSRSCGSSGSTRTRQSTILPTRALLRPPSSSCRRFAPRNALSSHLGLRGGSALCPTLALGWIPLPPTLCGVPPLPPAPPTPALLGGVRLGLQSQGVSQSARRCSGWPLASPRTSTGARVVELMEIIG